MLAHTTHMHVKGATAEKTSRKAVESVPFILLIHNRGSLNCKVMAIKMKLSLVVLGGKSSYRSHVPSVPKSKS